MDSTWRLDLLSSKSSFPMLRSENDACLAIVSGCRLSGKLSHGLAPKELVDVCNSYDSTSMLPCDLEITRRTVKQSKLTRLSSSPQHPKSSPALLVDSTIHRCHDRERWEWQSSR